jgi:two-component system, chemotaxis family, CheB/CheR fusion protein
MPAMSNFDPTDPANAQLPKAQLPSPEAKAGGFFGFPIIGVGASAGGLEAFSQLLCNIPAGLELALVLIQHLSPQHESHLTELLARKTEMEVVEVIDGMGLEPHHVYVIPPDTNMAIAPEGLKLFPRQSQSLAPYRPIDYFFNSLAQLQGNQAIGIILSGTGEDGTQGVKAIKTAGGITFAQDQGSAQYPGMPQSAILAGWVDKILPPAQIATELAQICQHTYTPISDRPPTDSTLEQISTKPDNLSPIFQILRRATGVDFSYYKPQTMQRRTLRRMALQKITRLSDYAHYLQEHPEEIDALYQDVLINATGFFRNPEVFDHLQTKLFPQLVADLSRETPIRIWVAGCSTGEEAYSMVICFQEFLESISSSLSIQLFATDINEAAIEQARTGLYSERMITGLSPERLQRWFIKVENGYQISKMLRNVCVFAKHNLFSDPPFSNLDLISCRNVLIYLGPVLQKQLIPLFHYALKPNGFLVLGTSETMGEFPGLFAPLEKRHKIYAKKPAQVRPSLGIMAPGGLPEPGTTVLVAALPWNEQDLQHQADRLILANYGPANVIINDQLDILYFRGQTSLYLEPSEGKANFNILKMVRPSLQVKLRVALSQIQKLAAGSQKTGLAIKAEIQVKEVHIKILEINTPPGSRPPLFDSV